MNNSIELLAHDLSSNFIDCVRTEQESFSRKDGGKQRSTSCNIATKTCVQFIKSALSHLDIHPSRYKIEENKKISVKQGDSGTEYDVLVYIDDKLKLVIESKAYCDKSMYKRYILDAASICEEHDCASCVFELESSMPNDYKNIYSRYESVLITDENKINTKLTLLKTQRDSRKHPIKYFNKDEMIDKSKFIDILECMCVLLS
jgi:hypothetical protein